MLRKPVYNRGTSQGVEDDLMKFWNRILASLLALGLAMLPAGAQAPAKTAEKAPAKSTAQAPAKAPAKAPARAAGPRVVQQKFTDQRLKNGLRVILAEDHSAPTYSISVTYNVGSRDERKGRTGFAHLFEHMMFQGSENVGKGEHFLLVFNNGGNMNGTTNADRTNYFQTLPANQLDLGLFLEADRMKSLVINRANLDNQREAVKEEKRLSSDNQPYGKTIETMLDTAYDNFAYKHSTIGSMDDLNAATVEDVAEFFRIYYAPNNATLVLVGDFLSAVALQKIEKYFGSIPAQPAPPVPDVTEPAQKGERRKSIDDSFAQLPRIDIAHKIPPSNTPDFYAMDMLLDILGSGQSSRLYQKIVKDKQAALQCIATPLGFRGPSLALLIAIVPPNKDLAEVEKLIYEEIERVKNEPVEDWEIEKTMIQNRRQIVQSMQSTLTRANLLGQFAVYYDDPGLFNNIESRYKDITKADLQRVARAYLNAENRTVIITNPKRAAAPPSKSGGL
jgi:predicted Zn-dependent peptidase